MIFMLSTKLIKNIVKAKKKLTFMFILKKAFRALIKVHWYLDPSYTCIICFKTNLKNIIKH